MMHSYGANKLIRGSVARKIISLLLGEGDVWALGFVAGGNGRSGADE